MKQYDTIEEREFNIPKLNLSFFGTEAEWVEYLETRIEKLMPCLKEV